MSFSFRTSIAGAVLIPSSILQQLDLSKCAFIKCFLALPQQKYKHVRTIATQTLSSSGEWIELNNETSENFQCSKMFLKLKLFTLEQHDASYNDIVLAGNLDIFQVLDTLSRSRSLRKLLVSN